MAVVHQMSRKGKRIHRSKYTQGNNPGLRNFFISIGIVFCVINLLALIAVIPGLFAIGNTGSPVLQKIVQTGKDWFALIAAVTLRIPGQIIALPGTIKTGDYLSIALFCGKLIIYGIVIIGISYMISSFAGKRTERSIREGGDRGEKLALDLMRKLPDSYHVFTNLEFEMRGHHETDLIIAGPAGIMVCEVKYWNGIIERYDDRYVTRIYPTGEHVQMHSPVHQVIAHYETLRDALKREGITVPVRGMVLIDHPNATIRGLEHSQVPVLVTPDIKDVTQCLGRPCCSDADIRNAVHALQKIAV